MAYNEHLADRVRRIFEEKKVSNIEEKKMMGGLTFMVNEKMCIGTTAQTLAYKLPSILRLIHYRPNLSKYTTA